MMKISLGMRPAAALAQAAVILCCVSASLCADIEAELSSPDTLSILPGTVLKAGVVVFNRSDVESRIVEALEIPTDWQLVTPHDSVFHLGPGEQALRLLVLYAPQLYPPGFYDVKYAVRRRGDAEPADMLTFTVGLLEARKLDLLVIASPLAVIAGEVWEASLELVNSGNGAADLELAAKAIPAASVAIEPGEVHLEPGGADTLTLRLPTNSRLRQKLRHAVELEVRPKGEGHGKGSVSKVVWFETVPRVTRGPDTYRRLRSDIALVTVIEEGRARPQVDFSGSGSLDAAGRRKAGFRVRSPDIEDLGRYGKRDEYWLYYKDQHGYLALGDRTYYLSPLTQRYDYGRGAELHLSAGGVGLGGFFVESRDAKSGSGRVGGKLSYTPGPGFKLAGNVLVKANDSTFCDDCGRSEVYSVEAGISPDQRISLEAEYGMSRTGGTGKLRGYAYHVRLGGRLSNRLRYSIERIHTGPEYMGYYRGVAQTIASTDFPVYGKLHGNIFYHESRKHPSHQPTSGTADRVRNLKAGLTHQGPKDIRISLGFAAFLKKDLLLPSEHEFTEKTGVLGLAQNFRRFSVQVQMEYGVLEDNLRGSGGMNVERYGLSANLRPGHDQTYVFYARNGHERFTDNPEREWSAGVSARQRFGDHVNLNIDLLAGQKGTDLASRRYTLSSMLRVNLLRGHLLSLGGHIFKRNGQGSRETSLYLTYSVPLALPTGRKSSTGCLRGRIYDAEFAEKRPLRDVVLSAGGIYAVSDDDGEFLFPALKPGSYLLEIEQQSLGFARVTLEKMPIEVKVAGGETTELEIGVTSSCRLTGRVSLLKLEPGRQVSDFYGLHLDSAASPMRTIQPDLTQDQLVEAGGLRAVVELINGTETLRQVTDADGVFDFRHIRPGKWHVGFRIYSLPASHRLEEEELVVELEPGEARFITTRAVPQIRPIRVIGGGHIRAASD